MVKKKKKDVATDVLFNNLSDADDENMDKQDVFDFNTKADDEA